MAQHFGLRCDPPLTPPPSITNLTPPPELATPFAVVRVSRILSLPLPTRPVAALLVFAALVYACGPHSRTSDASTKHNASGGRDIASSLGVEVSDQVAFAFHVTNNAARRIELMFPSGRTHDIVVLDSTGREVWRWSEGRLFTQALQTRTLESSETLTYEAAWTPGEQQGTFTVVASLLSQNHPLERRIEFAVP